MIRDRDTVLKSALKLATSDKVIYVAYRELDGNWFACTYHQWHTIDNPYTDTIRYILPNGEVTKLS